MSASPSRPKSDVKVAATVDEVQACYDVRVEVFVVEQGFPHDTEIDDLDPLSVHFLLYVSEPSPPTVSTSSIMPSSSDHRSTAMKPVGTVRYTGSKGKVSRLAILKAYRGKGYSNQLMHAVDDYVRKHGEGPEEEVAEVRTIKLQLNAQMQVIPFYEKLGWHREGDVFDEEGAPHMRMVKDLQL